MDRRFHPARNSRIQPGLGQILGPGVADYSDSVRLYYRPCLFLHPLAFYPATGRRQRFCSRCFHCPGGCLARTDARVSKTGERESSGGAEHCAVFHERWNRIAYRIVAGNCLLRFQTARATRSDRAVSAATAKIDQLHSRTDSGYLSESGFANQCRRDQPNAGTVRLHSQRDCSGRCLQGYRSNDGEIAGVQRIRIGAFRLLQQHAEPHR